MTGRKRRKRPVGRPTRPMPEPIPDTPENVARILMNAPQRKRSDWEFIKEQDRKSPVPVPFSLGASSESSPKLNGIFETIDYLVMPI